MRGHDEQTHHMFSCLSPEQRVPADHPLRAVRALTDHALKTMSRRFAGLYAKTGRPSIPPEQLLRALLLQVLYGEFGGAVQDESETAISLNLTIPPSRSCRRRRPSLAHHLLSVCVLPPKELTERCAMAASLSSRVGLRTFHHVRGH